MKRKWIKAFSMTGAGALNLYLYRLAGWRALAAAIAAQVLAITWSDSQ